MEFCIGSDALRKALAEVEAAEANGFMHCQAIFKLTSAGQRLDDCRAEYSDLSERAHPTNPALNWGRFQGVTRKHRFEGGRLHPLPRS